MDVAQVIVLCYPWVLSAPDGPHVGPMNLAIRDSILAVTPSMESFIKKQMNSGVISCVERTINSLGRVQILTRIDKKQ